MISTSKKEKLKKKMHHASISLVYKLTKFERTSYTLYFPKMFLFEVYCNLLARAFSLAAHIMFFE